MSQTGRKIRHETQPVLHARARSKKVCSSGSHHSEIFLGTLPSAFHEEGARAPTCTASPKHPNLACLMSPFLVLLVNDSEYSRLAGAKPFLSLSCIYLVSPGARRAPTPPRPPFWGEGSTKKKSPASALALGHVCVGAELGLKGTQSLAVRPETAWFLFFLLAFASSS